jgi:hypothetical protein
MRSPRKKWLAGVLAVAIFLVPAAPAAAAGVQKGTYECFDLGYWFKLKGKGKYKVQTGGGGKWKGKNKLTFKSGPMDFAYGVPRDDSTGALVIDLYFKDGGSFAASCPRI